MSTVNGLNSNSYVYSPTLNTYKGESNLLQDSATASDSSLSTSDLANLSNELNQIDQGIDPQEAVKYEPSSQASAALQQNSTYTSMMSNYSTGLGLIQSINQSTTTDSITALSNQMNLLNQGIDESTISAVSGILGQTATSTAAATDMAALGEQLNQLNAGINLADVPNILNYNYSPSEGINTTPYSNTASGSNLDLKL